MFRSVNRYRLGVNMNKFGRSVLTVLDSMSPDYLSEEGEMLSAELRTLANRMSTTTRLAHDYPLVRDIEELMALVLRQYNAPVLYDEDDQPITSDVEIYLEEYSHWRVNIKLEIAGYNTANRAMDEMPSELLAEEEEPVGIMVDDY